MYVLVAFGILLVIIPSFSYSLKSENSTLLTMHYYGFMCCSLFTEITISCHKQCHDTVNSFDYCLIHDNLVAW